MEVTVTRLEEGVVEAVGKAIVKGGADFGGDRGGFDNLSMWDQDKWRNLSFAASSVRLLVCGNAELYT